MSSIQQKRDAILSEIRTAQAARTIHVAPRASENLLQTVTIPEKSTLSKINDLQQVPKKNLEKAREVFKDLKTKQCFSRDTREEKNGICLRPSIGESQDQCLEANVLVLGDNCSAAANTTSREITGISAQQSKSKQGIKVSLTIQTNEDALLGNVIKLTAEMKRSSRLRELKPYSSDSEEFAQIYHNAKQSIKELDKESRELICLGRIHESGKRASWFADMCLVGTLNTSGILDSIIFMSSNEEYFIKMDNTLSRRQEEIYLSAGFFGKLVTTREAPTLQSARRIPYGK